MSWIGISAFLLWTVPFVAFNEKMDSKYKVGFFTVVGIIGVVWFLLSLLLG